MNEKYLAYVSMLASRDQVLTTLASMAVAIVLAWSILQTLPPYWRDRLNRVYLFGAAIGYLALMIGLVFWQGEA